MPSTQIINRVGRSVEAIEQELSDRDIARSVKQGPVLVDRLSREDSVGLVEKILIARHVSRNQDLTRLSELLPLCNPLGLGSAEHQHWPDRHLMKSSDFLLNCDFPPKVNGDVGMRT